MINWRNVTGIETIIKVIKQRKEIEQKIKLKDNTLLSIKQLIKEKSQILESLKKEKNENNFLLMKRIEELKELIISEVELQDDENNYLLFNPGYDS